MENDLISRSALIDSFKKTKIDDVFPNWKELGCVAKTSVIRTTIQYRAIILNAPSVDAVEVVRCEKCVHFDIIDGTPYCHYWSRNTEENGFCHNGI